MIDVKLVGDRRYSNVDQVGGRPAVSSTVASTKQSVMQLQRRGADLLSRSEGGGVSDFSQKSDAPSVSSGSRRDGLRRIGIYKTARGNGINTSQEPAGDGSNRDARAVSGASSVTNSEPVFSRAYGGQSPR